MKLSIYIVCLFAISIWASPSVAGTWYSNQTIQYLYAGEAGNRHAVRVVGTQPNPNSCAQSYDLMIQLTNKRIKEMWAMLLSAYMADKPVGIYLSGCDPTENLPVITDIKLGE